MKPELLDAVDARYPARLRERLGADAPPQLTALGNLDLLTVPKTALEMKRRGHGATAIEKVVYQNPQKFLSQCARFKIASP